MTREALDSRKGSIAAEVAMTVAGLTMTATPLALWIVPDIVTFKLVLVVFAVACWLVVLLARFRRDDPPPGGASRHGPLEALPGDAIERLQNRGDLSRRQPGDLKRLLRRE